MLPDSPPKETVLSRYAHGRFTVSNLLSRHKFNLSVSSVFPRFLIKFGESNCTVAGVESFNMSFTFFIKRTRFNATLRRGDLVTNSRYGLALFVNHLDFDPRFFIFI